MSEGRLPVVPARHAEGRRQGGEATALRSRTGADRPGAKGGPVISDIRLADTPVEGQLRASAGSGDVLLGFDLLGAAAADTLAVADPARTVVVVNTAQTPTAAMITDTTASFPAGQLPVRRIEARDAA